jgi:hypothetical protein
MLTKEDLIKNHIYSAKRKQYLGFHDMINDRMIIWMSETKIQYDSPTIRDGRHYPTIPIEQFLKWAKEDVTPKLPIGGWRTKCTE